MLKGVLFTYKHEGPESCNCHSKTRRDFHIWITEPGARNRRNAVIVELSPPEQDLHPDVAASLPALKGRIVCATGWLFFDPEHPSQLGKTRWTLWEVHPVTDIRECQ